MAAATATFNRSPTISTNLSNGVLSNSSLLAVMYAANMTFPAKPLGSGGFIRGLMSTA